MSDEAKIPLSPDSPAAFLNRELSWLGFARRVLALVESHDLPLLERVKFAGIMGMLHDEFFMKRISGLKRQMTRASKKTSIDGRTPAEEFAACREELLVQNDVLDRVVREELLPALRREGLGLLDWTQLTPAQQDDLREQFKRSLLPILTPLAVDAEHPFPFISNLGLNLAVTIPASRGARRRFIRIKVPDNRPRWVPLADRTGFAPLEQVIAANLDLLVPQHARAEVHVFRVTRGAEGEPPAPIEDFNGDVEALAPGSIVQVVANELKARRFAGVVRLQVDSAMPRRTVEWLAAQLGARGEDVYTRESFLGMTDLLKLEAPGAERLRHAPHTPVVHPRLRELDPAPEAIFDEIARGDLLLHHPYHDFDSSVLRFLESAAADPAVLAIKLTIYRTSKDSPIVRALAEAARRGKQVAVLVEITARFDEAPNIAWGKLLESEGVHVAYGVERLKTHVKLALVVREELGRLRRYVHIGTGNYHTGTARIYEDLGLLTCDEEVCADVTDVFNSLTSGAPHADYRKLLIAPVALRERFAALIRREAEHARAGRPAGIDAKMNQLQDPEIIRELYRASQAGVPIRLNVRGLCCLRPGVPGLSENIRVLSVVGRFLEHSRLFRFQNGGAPEYFTGSADWMKRNLDNRVESVVPVLDPRIRRELDDVIAVYETDNCSAWDCGPDGVYARRTPAAGEPRRAAQEVFARMASVERAPHHPAEWPEERVVEEPPPPSPVDRVQRRAPHAVDH